MQINKNLANIKSHLVRYSFVNSGDYFTKNIVKDLKDTSDKIFLSKKYSLYNNTMRKLPLLKINSNKILLNLIYKIKSFLEEVYVEKLYLNKVLFQNKNFYNEIKNNSFKQLPYVQHIDKNRFLKALIYLDEITIDRGPIHFSLTQKENYEKRRQDIIKKTPGFSNITNEESVFKAAEGNCGDVIIFDTNCPHHAGIGNNNLSRKAVRIDFETLDWNNFYFLNKLKIKIKNLVI